VEYFNEDCKQFANFRPIFCANPVFQVRNEREEPERRREAYLAS
jgi:hypothetical protein